MIEMNVNTLLGNFEVLAEAPDGIEKLRELILRLAAEGLLIDPSLSENEVVELIASDNKSANKPELKSFCNSHGKVVYEIQIADAADLVQQAQSKIKTNQIKPSGEYPVVDQGQQFISGFIDGVTPINASHNAVLVFGDHTRNIKYIDFDFVVGADGVKVLRTKYLDPKFFYYMARSINLPSRGYGRHYRAFCSSYIPIFSQTEQMMTVSTIEKLMALCDQLEQQQKHRDNLRTATRKSAIDAISTATTPEELEIAWKRINNNWEAIANTPESIDALRKLVLDIFTMPKTFQSESIHKLGDVVSVLNGDRSANYPSKEHRVEFGIPFINAGHLQNGEVEMSEMDYITQNKFLSLKGGKIQDGDLLFCLRGSLGKCAIVNGIKEGTVASSLAILRPNRQVNSKYLLRFLQSGSCARQIKQFDNGSAQPNLAAKSILNFELYLPALSDQELVVAKVDDLMALCDQLESELKSRSEVAEKFARSVVSSA